MSWHSSAHRPYKIAISIARGERNVFLKNSAMQGNNLLHEKIDNYCQATFIHKNRSSVNHTDETLGACGDGTSNASANKKIVA
jgi:hypothetical protein